MKITNIEDCDNPCKNFMEYGCGNNECNSTCHQEADFYKQSRKLQLQKMKLVEERMAKEKEAYDLQKYEELKLKFN